MREKRGAERAQRLLDAVPQPLADPATVVDTLLEESLQDAARRVGRGVREPGAVQQSVQDDELAVEVALHHRFHVELDVRRPRHPRGIAQQPQLRAVRDEPPEAVRAVEVLLHRAVRAAPLARDLRIELAVDAHDLDGRRLRVLAGPKLDDEGLATRRRRALPRKIEAEPLEQRHGERLAGHGRRAFRGVRQPALERVPVGAHIREGALQLVQQASPGREPEVLGPLPGRIAGRHPVKQIGGEEAALGRDRDVRHQRPPVGTRT